MLGNISYRFKVPLAMVTGIMISGLVVTVALTGRAYGDLRQELFRNAVEVGSVLSSSLPEAIKNDDLWRAYQLVRAAGESRMNPEDRLMIVLDTSLRIYVSNHSKEFPTLSALREFGPEMARVERAVATGGSLEPRPYESRENSRIYVIFPMLTDGVAIGTLVIGYSRDLFWPRFLGIVQRVTLSSVAVIALLLPLGWYLGKRMVAPLTRLSSCLVQVGQRPLDQISCNVHEGRDEIGRLGTHFNQMLQAMQEKERLEGEMVKSERLAAVGRLAAGVAHEINNPLGGMMNAISTHRKHAQSDPLTEKTMSLIQRGLEQIRETVSALLVEARSESHALTPQDVEDVHRLLEPDATRRTVILNWRNEILAPIALPSTPIRQVLLNLSLNAVEATPHGGEVACLVRCVDSHLAIDVVNEGEGIVDDEIDTLFEPFTHRNSGGSGLGLWVTYQIVSQLQGEIDVVCRDGRTHFAVRLPLEQAA